MGTTRSGGGRDISRLGGAIATECGLVPRLRGGLLTVRFYK